MLLVRKLGWLHRTGNSVIWMADFWKVLKSLKGFASYLDQWLVYPGNLTWLWNKTKSHLYFQFISYLVSNFNFIFCFCISFIFGFVFVVVVVFWGWCKKFTISFSLLRNSRMVLPTFVCCLHLCVSLCHCTCYCLCHHSDIGCVRLVRVGPFRVAFVSFLCEFAFRPCCVLICPYTHYRRRHSSSLLANL